MLSHLLIPLDGSALAEMALPEAKRILRSKGHLTLVTVVEAPEFPIYGFDMAMVMVRAPQQETDKSLKHARDYLENIAADLRVEGYRVDVVVKTGEAAAAIVEAAEKCDADAIVICTHGRSGLQRWLFGSITNKVLSVARCPIYVVPNLRKEDNKQALTHLEATIS